jgi:hypothetical protein
VLLHLEFERGQRHRPLIDIIVQALGPSKPETLELVATLHFVNARQKGILGTRQAEESVFKEFRSIKGNKFSDKDMHFWYHWLDESNLL